MQLKTQKSRELAGVEAKSALNDLGLIMRPKTPIYSVPFSMPQNASSVWVYILAKANRYLRLGPDLYRKADYFGMPGAEYDEETLNEIESCFRQFLDHKGYLEVNPVENVSISGFYAALCTLHFEVVEQNASFNWNLGFVLDSILFEHVVDKRSIRLFNKVAHDTEMLAVIQQELLTPASGVFQEDL